MNSNLDNLQNDNEDILKATKAVASCLASQKYAIVGGAACAALGSARITEDVDVVLVRGGIGAARALIRADFGSFIVEKGSLHTTYHGQTRLPVKIDLLAPPTMFKAAFDMDTPVISIDGIRVLKPALILDAKLASWERRSIPNKKLTDAVDITFLLDWHLAHGKTLDARELTNLKASTVEAIMGIEPDWLAKFAALKIDIA